MSLIFIESDYLVSSIQTDIPIGTPVVIDEVKKVVPFDSGVDSVDDIFGVAYPKDSATGRCAANFDGLVFSDHEYFKYGENLQRITPYVANPDYAPVDPVLSNDPIYALVCISGMAAVLKTFTTIPPRWMMLREGTDYDIYLIR
jgi:hypothetical protein